MRVQPNAGNVGFSLFPGRHEGVLLQPEAIAFTAVLTRVLEKTLEPKVVDRWHCSRRGGHHGYMQEGEVLAPGETCRLIGRVVASRAEIVCDCLAIRRAAQTTPIDLLPKPPALLGVLGAVESEIAAAAQTARDVVVRPSDIAESCGE